MITHGSRVICINDRFPIQVLDWTEANLLPRKGCAYTVTKITHAQCALTKEVGIGYVLDELDSPTSKICFSHWRFEELADAIANEREYQQLELYEMATGQPCFSACGYGSALNFCGIGQDA